MLPCVKVNGSEEGEKKRKKIQTNKRKELTK